MKSTFVIVLEGLDKRGPISCTPRETAVSAWRSEARAVRGGHAFVLSSSWPCSGPPRPTNRTGTNGHQPRGIMPQLEGRSAALRLSRRTANRMGHVDGLGQRISGRDLDSRKVSSMEGRCMQVAAWGTITQRLQKSARVGDKTTRSVPYQQRTRSRDAKRV